MRPIRRSIQGVVLVLLIAACTPGPETTPPPSTTPSPTAGALIGGAAPAIFDDFLAAGFERIDPDPSLVRAAQGRPLLVALHRAPDGFAVVALFDDPVSRVIFSIATDQDGLEAFGTLLSDRGLVEARDWLDARHARAASDPTISFVDKAVLPSGLGVSYERQVARRDPGSAVVTVIIGS